MAKKRIYELAKEKGVSNKEILWILEKLNIKVKSHMSALESDQEQKINEYYKKLEKKVVAEKEEKKQVVQAKKIEEIKKEPEMEEKTAEKKSILKPMPKKVDSKKPVEKQEAVKSNQPVKKDSAPPSKKKEFNNSNKKGGYNSHNRQGGFNKKNNRYGKNKFKNNQPKEEVAEVVIKKITIGEEIQVKDLAMRMNKAAGEVIKKLMGLGAMATINQYVDFDTASLIAQEFGIEEVEFKSVKRQTKLKEIEDKPDTLKERPPIITVMGHVDHGKTSLLDAVRSANVMATEAGGITQHIGAYQINYKGRKITFIDTPGHAAFTSMRARGAKITDIAILVVAADDGVMPQTIEAISHAKAAEVPIIVAVNKIDKPGADPSRVMQQLTEHGLVPEEWGGDTIFVQVSAKKRENIDALLEMVLLVAEVEDLKANPNRLAEGFVLEAKLDREKGVVASLLVSKGTLKVSDMILTGESFGKIRAMMNDSGKRIKQAGPSMPVEVLGLSDVPEAGDIFQAVKDERLASHLANERKIVKKEEIAKKNQKVSLENLFEKISEENLKELNIILKGDVHGTVEALAQSIAGINTEEVKVNIIHEGVGAISETDVKLAMASNGLIIGFNVRPDTNAKKLAQEESVDIRLYRIIYEVLEDIKQAIGGLLDPDIKEVELGSAEVRQLIKVPKVGVIAGCYVVEGKITNTAKIRVVRDGVIVHEGDIDALKRFKDEIKEVAQGYECGISVVDFNDIKEGDILEAFTYETIARKID
ncbi:translation initiation factor IF-2 [endosymbiont 'TC1' of Trimyema compressum]|uniref:translation initiation factor IF-2 n=1 Tax=endosymbiont 'TC1' of Trimyema compressum TaxID=243899 RepID=UPI0007F0B3CB|nr:translation initiation factor IF-2 [endosymbiont 'TC1' of Trimyema compressum]AMP20400.1 translation initiation factor IF-2 [endosymbiont 'TC1' of Trimyema compressum]